MAGGAPAHVGVVGGQSGPGVELGEAGEVEEVGELLGEGGQVEEGARGQGAGGAVGGDGLPVRSQPRQLLLHLPVHPLEPALRVQQEGDEL